MGDYPRFIETLFPLFAEWLNTGAAGVRLRGVACEACNGLELERDKIGREALRRWSVFIGNLVLQCIDRSEKVMSQRHSYLPTGRADWDGLAEYYQG